jgi:DNA-binding transcriptional LysR family regulator
MPLSTRQLEVIHAVIKAGSVTDAAMSLGVSQPAVSMILRECSEVAGFPLFVRRQGRLQPTTETYVLLPELERVFEGMRRVQRLLSDLKDQTVGFVNIGSVPVVSDAIMPRLLRTFQANHPKIQVNLFGMNNDEVIDHIETDRVDFGLTLSPYPSQMSHIVDLIRTPLVFISHENHPLAQKQRIVPDDLVDSQLITFNRTLPIGVVIENAFRQTSARRTAAVEITHTSTACIMARHEVGVALVPELGLRQANLEGLVQRPFFPETHVIIQLWLPQHKTMSRSAKLALTALKKVATEFENPSPA